MKKLNDAPGLTRSEGWLSLPQAAEVLGCSRQHVGRLAADGEFASLFKIGPYFVVDADDVEKLSTRLKTKKKK